MSQMDFSTGGKVKEIHGLGQSVVFTEGKATTPKIRIAAYWIKWSARKRTDWGIVIMQITEEMIRVIKRTSR